jgi:hypothetical protein
MILLEIQHMGVAIAEFEGDAPRAIDVNREAGRIEAPQLMEVEAGDVHVFGPAGCIKGIKAFKSSLLEATVDFGSRALPEIGQLLVSERLDHIP